MHTRGGIVFAGTEDVKMGKAQQQCSLFMPENAGDAVDSVAGQQLCTCSSVLHVKFEASET